MMWLRRLLRAVAIAIVVMGVVDPVITWPRTDRPLVSLIDAGAPALIEQVARELSREQDVHRGPIAGAAATVVVGRAVPADSLVVSGALIGVTPALVRPRVEIEQVVAPETVSPASRIPVTATWRALGANGRTLRVELYAGAVLQDRTTQAVASDDARVVSSLSAAAMAAGASRLTVRIRDAAAADPSLNADATATTETTVVRWKVLVADARPSWASTFVRRALEDDRRFDVASRVATSRAISAEAGAAPAQLDAAALEAFAAVVIGAPDALTESDARALEAFARRRGGAVVLLMDRVATGPFMRLTGAVSFRDVHGVERRKVVGDAGTLIATELALPDVAMPGAETLATNGAGAGARVAVWQTPLGAGRVVVNGALDAWRYRAREGGGFSRFWTGVISAAAAASPAALTVSPQARAVRPGAAVNVRVVVRRVQLSDPLRPAPAVTVAARLAAADGASGGEPVRLWPTPERGVFMAPVRASHRAGVNRIVIDARDDVGVSMGSASADVIVGEVALTSSTAQFEAWTTSRGGVVVSGAQLRDVAATVRARVSVAARPAAGHPMRSPWWLPMLVCVLGGEWWLRRRNGER